MKIQDRAGIKWALVLLLGSYALWGWSQTDPEQETADEQRIPRVAPSYTPTRALDPGVAPAPSSAAVPPAPDPGANVHPLPRATPAEMAESNRIMRDKRAARQAQMAADSMDPATREAWSNWSTDSYPRTAAGEAAKKRDFLTLQRDWEQVQVEAHKGTISPEQNKQFLDAHSRDMQQRYQAAAEANGLEVKLQDPSGQPKVFSDVDIHGYPKGAGEADWKPGQPGEMTVEQFKAARQDFNDRFNADLQANGLDPVPALDKQGLPDSPSRRMRTDLMPITDDRALFQGVEAHINPEGGVMYQCGNAVCQEVANRRTGPDGQSLGDATPSSTKADYLNEQYRQQRAHTAESQHLLEEGNRLINKPGATPEEVAEGLRMLERAQGEGSSLVGKYEDRGNKTVDRQAGRTGSEGMDVSETRQAAIDDLGDTRDHTVTQQSADVAATSENAIRNQQTEGARTMAAEGKLSDAAEMGRNAADANTRGQILEASREGAYARHQERIRNANPDWSQADIDAAARVAANDDVGRIAQEMRSQTPDVPDPDRHRWDINENPNRGVADADAMVNASGQDARDLAAVEEARSARAAASEVAEETLSAAAQARRTVDTAGRMVDAAALGAQIGEAGVRQAGKAIDENRDLDAGDVGMAALEAAGVPGMYALGNRISREVLIEVQRGNIRPQDAADVIAARLVGEVGNAMLVAPVQQAIKDEWEAAAREGREPSYVSAAGDAAVEIGGNMTGIRQLADAAMEPGTWEARAAAAAQAAAMSHGLESSARLTDKEITRLQNELEQLSVSGDLSDPATLAAIQDRTQALRDANDKMQRIQATANRNASSLSDENLASVNALANSQTRPEDMEDYIQQTIRDRQAEASGDELADAFAAAGDADAADWDVALGPQADRFADAFAASEGSTQAGAEAQRVFSDSADDVTDVDLEEMWAAEDAREDTAEGRRRDVMEAARRADDVAWSATMAAVNVDTQAQDQLGQQGLAAAQAQGQAAVAAAQAAPDPRMSAADMGSRMGQLQDQADQLAREREQILSGGANAPAGPLDPSKGGQYGGAAIAAAARGDETGFDQRQANCNDVVKSGGNAPASIAIAGAAFGGSATLNWDHYGVKDRIALLSGGSVVFDSGCVAHKGTTPVSVGGQIKVIVEPNCAQTSNSAWEFTVACNSSLAQQ